MQTVKETALPMVQSLLNVELVLIAERAKGGTPPPRGFQTADSIDLFFLPLSVRVASTDQSGPFQLGPLLYVTFVLAQHPFGAGSICWTRT